MTEKKQSDWEKWLEKKNILDQTILLNWLRSNTELYSENKEVEFERVLKEFVVDIVSEQIAKAKSEGWKECKEMLLIPSKLEARSKAFDELLEKLNIDKSFKGKEYLDLDLLRTFIQNLKSKI